MTSWLVNGTCALLIAYDAWIMRFGGVTISAYVRCENDKSGDLIMWLTLGLWLHWFAARVFAIMRG